MTKPECPYCGATKGLRVACDGGGFVAPDYICADCFMGQDEGPCFDDLAEAPRIFELCEHCGGEGVMYRQHWWYGGDEVPDGDCPVCDGKGVVEIEVLPIEMDDLDEIAGDFAEVA
jgi:hypothetical protein